MKKVVVILALLASVCGVVAQNNEGIDFFHGSFEEAKAKAQEQKKLIFVDFYTNWCGPCFNMAKKVFVIPEVGNFYNDKFICLKIDAESEKGKIIAKQYAVRSYPSYIFINPANGNIIHRSGGRKSVEEFIALGKAATDTKTTSVHLISEYKKGNRDKDFLISYVSYKSSVYDRYVVEKAFKEIFENGGKLTEPKIWKLYVKSISDYCSSYLKEVSDNYSTFVNLFGKEEVDAKLAKETVYCDDEFMAQLCDFEGKEFNLRLRKISDHIFDTKNYPEAIKSIDALIADTSVNQQKKIERLKFMIRLNKRYGPDYPFEWLSKCVEYLRYFAYNDAKRDDVRIHFDYALGLEMLLERVAEEGKEIPVFLKTAPEYGKKEYSSRPAELKMKPRYKKK